MRLEAFRAIGLAVFIAIAAGSVGWLVGNLLVEVLR